MMNDRMRWLIAFIVLGGSMFSGKYVPEQYTALKYIGWLCSFFIALFIVYDTVIIKTYKTNLTAAWTELLKVTWPSKDETVKTSIMVSIVVCVFAIIMWFLDAGLTKIVASVI